MWHLFLCALCIVSSLATYGRVYKTDHFAGLPKSTPTQVYGIFEAIEHNDIPLIKSLLATYVPWFSEKTIITPIFFHAIENKHARLSTIKLLVAELGDKLQDTSIQMGGILRALRSTSKNRLKIATFLLEKYGKDLSDAEKENLWFAILARQDTAALSLLTKIFGKEITDAEKNNMFANAAGHSSQLELVTFLDQFDAVITHKTKIQSIINAIPYWPNNENVIYLVRRFRTSLTEADKNKIFEIALKENPGLTSYILEQFKLQPHHLPTHTIQTVLATGNIALAHTLAQLGIKLSEQKPIEHLVDAMLYGLKKSPEIHKYKALLHLMDTAGITVSSELRAYLNTQQPEDPKLFDELNSYLHLLATYYLQNAAEYELAAKATNPLAAYNHIYGKALEMMDNDYMLEVMVLNGIMPYTLEKPEMVYRGIRGNFNPRDVQAFFEVGHKAYAAHQSMVFGFSTWLSGIHWEFNGTFVSFSPYHSAHVMFQTGRGDKALLLEIALPHGTPYVCGESFGEYEIIVHALPGTAIKAIYEISRKGVVENVYTNPNYRLAPGEAPARYAVGERISKKASRPDVLRYKKLDCSKKHQNPAIKTPEELARMHEQIHAQFHANRIPISRICNAAEITPEERTTCARELFSL